MDNRIELSDSSIIEILNIVKEKENQYFRFIPRDIESGKNPRTFMIELGLSTTDVINIIKSLTKENFYECLLDRKNQYIYLYVLKKEIEGIMTYIKIGFINNDKTGNVDVVSFHKDMEV